MMRTLKTSSPAKLNLFLYIKGRDYRGYHLLQSLFITIPSLTDKISIELNDSGLIRIESNVSIADNIITKAGRKLLDFKEQQNIGVDFRLEKNIPIGAGLGGGSSNAATALIALNKMLHLNLSLEQLIEISDDIGDDIKFFLMQKNAVYLDGNEMHEINLKQNLHLLLVKPDFSINTKEVYDEFRKSVQTPELQPTVIFEDILDHIIKGDNHLYNTVKKIHPQIENIVDELGNQEGCITARMSGSGSTCFGIFSNPELSEIAMNTISQLHPEWVIHSCKVQC
jgi:4-diphosphocytidyl-2-C-methyl-D-erythritol kinase